MNIKRLKIDGFKNIFETNLSLSDFNALIALNNYGKSNFLDAVIFANKFIQASSKEKKLMMSAEANVPVRTVNANRDFLFEIEFDFKFNSESYIVFYSFSFEWIRNNDAGKRIIAESLKLKKAEKGAKYVKYIERKHNKKYYLNSEKGRCDKIINIADNNLIINKLYSYDNLFYFDVVEKINNFSFQKFSLKNLDAFFYLKMAFDNDANEFSLKQSITQLLFELEKNNYEKYKLLENSLLDLLPELEYIKPIELDFKTTKVDNLPFVKPEKIYDVRVKEKFNNQELSIGSLSIGTKRIITVLLYTLLADLNKTDLICFEELENSIHPALLQRLLMLISNLSANTQILITSHSPHLIKYLELNDIFIGLPNKQGVAIFKKIKKSKHKKILKYAQDMEVHIGDFIFDLLISEEDDDFWEDYFG